ncbi:MULTISPECIES: DUF4307 domain-containing protein [Rothia]|uniref:DUF4307 domain-containing protein n=1 Tax=Rothia kristinae TaxID=37923 RepID=A0A0Q3BEV8_9MICC|nr:DUF4307 domain-containing protein [Rothia kristinae]MDN5640431.1 DUF4307 domain-containing protein [Actinomycetes bacterium]TDP56084.1 uncharacterized protein DUF4307 [Kocuria sp. AG109]SIL92752.1 Uncharacterised protein [Mycobacteroides abscessus subsp. abscessus]KTR40912.1 hypothetical protein RSA5_00085 [Rothia kristinae]KTR59727.1 hypothetical protein SA11R_02875 [Rothia kristinae]
MTSSTLDQRYGKKPARTRPSRRALALLAVLVLVLASGFVAWIAAHRGTAPTYQEKSVQVSSPLRTSLDFDLTKRPDDDVRCAVQAVNDQRAVVGWKEIQVGRDAGATSRQHVDLLTTGRAETATVESCWVVDGA